MVIIWPIRGQGPAVQYLFVTIPDLFSWMFTPDSPESWHTHQWMRQRIELAIYYYWLQQELYECQCVSSCLSVFPYMFRPLNLNFPGSSSSLQAVFKQETFEQSSSSPGAIFKQFQISFKWILSWSLKSFVLLRTERLGKMLKVKLKWGKMSQLAECLCPRTHAVM